MLRLLAPFLLSLATPGLGASTAARSSDGVLSVPLPTGWSAEEPGEEDVVLRLQGPGAHLLLRTHRQNVGLLHQHVLQRTKTFVSQRATEGLACPAEAVQETQLADGRPFVHRKINCAGLQAPVYIGAFPLGDHVYSARWYTKAPDPFKFAFGVFNLLQPASEGPASGWLLSPDRKVMLPWPPGEVGQWEERTYERRHDEPDVIAHFKAGQYFVTVMQDYWKDAEGLAALAAGLAENKAKELGSCSKAGAGELKLPNGWALQGVALKCRADGGARTYSFGAFEAEGRAYSVFGVYDLKSLKSSLGSAQLVSELEKGPETMMELQDVQLAERPALVKWLALTAAPILAIVVLVLFARRRSPPPSPEPEPPSGPSGA